MCEYELPATRLSKVIVRQTRPKLYTKPLRGWLIITITVSDKALGNLLQYIQPAFTMAANEVTCIALQFSSTSRALHVLHKSLLLRRRSLMLLRLLCYSCKWKRKD